MSNAHPPQPPRDPNGNAPGGSAPRHTATHRFQYNPQRLREVEAELLDAVGKEGYSDVATFAIRLALEEAVVNAFKHGNRGRSGSSIELQWEVRPDRVTTEVADQGAGFDPEDVPDPLAPENLELPSGRGIMLMKQYMTEVAYNEAGNRVTMVYRRDRKDDSARAAASRS